MLSSPAMRMLAWKLPPQARLSKNSVLCRPPDCRRTWPSRRVGSVTTTLTSGPPSNSMPSARASSSWAASSVTSTPASVSSRTSVTGWTRNSRSRASVALDHPGNHGASQSLCSPPRRVPAVSHPDATITFQVPFRDGFDRGSDPPAGAWPAACDNQGLPCARRRWQVNSLPCEATELRMRVLLTGGCGFIGSAVVRHLIRSTGHTCRQCGQADLCGVARTRWRKRPRDPRHTLVRADIADHAAMRQLFATWQPDAVMHLAAETHVDRSIDGPGPFVQTNVVGTYTLLDAAREYWAGLPAARRAAFRFHHVSTDEVFGALGPGDPPFTETTPYDPRSPYAASKAASDHLVRAWHHTYGLPTLVSNTANNYGPWQFPEKLIPLVTLNAHRRQAPAGLWRRLQHARLDLRRGPCRGAGAGAGTRRARRHLCPVGPPAAHQPAGGARHLRRARRQRCPTRPGRASA